MHGELEHPSAIDRDIELARYIQFLQKSRLAQRIDYNPAESETLQKTLLELSEERKKTSDLTRSLNHLKEEMLSLAQQAMKANRKAEKSNAMSRRLDAHHAYTRQKRESVHERLEAIVARMAPTLRKCF